MTKKLLMLTGVIVTIASLAGCSSCGRSSSCSSWFNRGDRCCPPPACGPGVPQATMMLPSSPQVMPGPIEVAPTL
jgi:hypothetical protein